MHEDEREAGKIAYDADKPFLVGGNGTKDTDFIFRSILSAWNPRIHHQSVPSAIEAHAIKTGRFQVLGAPLDLLYKYAFFGDGGWVSDDTARYGRYYNTLILEVADSSSFQYSYKYGRNIYSYSLMAPPEKLTKMRLQEAMQRDLQTFFGFEPEIETRECPYWRLVATGGAKTRLKARGDSTYFEGLPKASFKARNWPFNNLIGMIRDFNPGIFLDETGIQENVDIDMDCILTDIDDIKKALQSNGLDLVLGEREMKVLVIKDRQPTFN
jgi:hypothetical protein